MQSGWSTTNTALAASFGALGFPIQTHVMQDDPNRRSHVETQFFIGARSLWSGLHRKDLHKSFADGSLEKEDPLHPLLQGLRARHNVECILDAQNKGRRIRLAGVGGSHATIYQDGEELAALQVERDCVETCDLTLAASLGTIGIPVIQITGSRPRHTYTLPNLGHHLWSWPDHVATRYEAVKMMRRKDGGRELMLETEEPNHPLVAAYNALAVYDQLKKHLGQTRRLVMIRPARTQRTAIVTENATDRVLERVERHLR